TYRVVRLDIGTHRQDESHLELEVKAPDAKAFERVRADLMSLGLSETDTQDAVLATVDLDGTAPDGFYSSNPFTGTFEKLPAAPGFDPAALLRNEIPALLRSELRSVTLVGTEKIGAADAYHVRAEADGAKLRALTGGLVVPGVHTVDLWIDGATSRIVRLVDVEPGGVAGWRLELSGSDKPVEIKAP
ncbi:MAG: LppX_LprAFG lipoprotein, partial [Chloroflexota bacterium]